VLFLFRVIYHTTCPDKVGTGLVVKIPALKFCPMPVAPNQSVV
jgi:hypothetical protein